MLRANHATIAALFLIYVLPLDPLGFASGPSYPFWTRLSYMFFHVNIWHLIGNSYALKVMRIGKREIARSYIMAVLASFFSTSRGERHDIRHVGRATSLGQMERPGDMGEQSCHIIRHSRHKLGDTSSVIADWVLLDKAI